MILVGVDLLGLHCSRQNIWTQAGRKLHVNLVIGYALALESVIAE